MALVVGRFRVRRSVAVAVVFCRRLDIQFHHLSREWCALRCFLRWQWWSEVASITLQFTAARSYGGVEHQHWVRDGLIAAAAVEEFVYRHHAVVIAIHFLAVFNLMCDEFMEREQKNDKLSARRTTAVAQSIRSWWKQSNINFHLSAFHACSTSVSNRTCWQIIFVHSALSKNVGLVPDVTWTRRVILAQLKSGAVSKSLPSFSHHESSLSSAINLFPSD